MNYEELMASLGSGANKSLLSPSIEALRRLLLKNGADLTNVPAFNLWDVVRWGFPLSYIPDDVFDSGLFSSLGKALLTDGKPNANEFAEVQVIGLLGACGANLFSTVQRTSNKTNDFIFSWGNSQVEVEVTKGSEKEEHVKRKAFAEKLTDELFRLKRPLDLLVDVSYGLSEESIERLLSAARNVKHGETISEENAWCVVGKPIDRGVGEIFKAGEVDVRPTWWAKDDIQLFCLKALVAGPGDKVAAPRVKVRFAAQFNGYLNAAKRKARRFQGSGALPYLIVLDANDLPNPFEAFAEGFSTHFPKWKHISGVLVFVDWRSHDEIGWTWRMFDNPHAARPLPAEMKDKMPFFRSCTSSVRVIP